MIIIGAGLSGLLAATQFQSAVVYESRPQGESQHRALLRFRSSAVGDAIGIEFRKVRVHKGLWSARRSAPPTIRLANQYSTKVLGRLGDRSIWNLDAVDRYIAPENLMEQLVERVGSRIRWNFPYALHGSQQVAKDSPLRLDDEHDSPPIISTMPMSVLVEQLAINTHPEFEYQSIFVTRYRVPNCDVFQTIYFPSPETAVYRASITGDVLIVESVANLDYRRANSEFRGELLNVMDAFGIDSLGEELSKTEQRYGKIAPIDDAWRRKFIAESTRRLNVYALGRFAVWRNILADDVLHDIAVIKRLLKGDAYGASLVSSGNQ